MSPLLLDSSPLLMRILSPAMRYRAPGTGLPGPNHPAGNMQTPPAEPDSSAKVSSTRPEGLRPAAPRIPPPRTAPARRTAARQQGLTLLVASLDVAQDAVERLGWRFAKLWAASTTSALGSGLALIAAPLLVASRTSNPVVVSGTFAAAWLPWLLFALPGGVLVDRVDRRRLMIVIDGARVAVMAVLATAILTGHVSIGLLYAVLFVVNAGEIVFRSASQAMIPSVVPRARLERANGWLVGGTTLMQGMIAGPLGGFLFVVAVSAPFFVNAPTYAVSAVLIGLVAGAYRAPPPAGPPAGRRAEPPPGTAGRAGRGRS